MAFVKNFGSRIMCDEIFYIEDDNLIYYRKLGFPGSVISGVVTVTVLSST